MTKSAGRVAMLGLAVVLACIVITAGTQNSTQNSGRTQAAAPAQSTAGGGTASELPTAVQIEPDEMAKILQSSKGQKPLVLHVGFKNFYSQARIPGSEYEGPASKPEGLEMLRKRLGPLPRKQFIVLYCGCCPWDKCPNVKPAYDTVRAMGFTNVKVIHIAENFGANWAAPGLPVSKGE